MIYPFQYFAGVVSLTVYPFQKKNKTKITKKTKKKNKKNKQKKNNNNKVCLLGKSKKNTGISKSLKYLNSMLKCIAVTDGDHTSLLYGLVSMVAARTFFMQSLNFLSSPTHLIVNTSTVMQIG